MEQQFLAVRKVAVRERRAFAQSNCPAATLALPVSAIAAFPARRRRRLDRLILRAQGRRGGAGFRQADVGTACGCSALSPGEPRAHRQSGQQLRGRLVAVFRLLRQHPLAARATSSGGMSGLKLRTSGGSASTCW